MPKPKSPRTPEQIADQIERLQLVKPYVPRYGILGGNWERIDAEIDVLEHDLSEGQIEYKYRVDETADEYEDGDNDLYYLLMDARRWMDGESDEAPAAGWEELAEGRN